MGQAAVNIRAENLGNEAPDRRSAPRSISMIRAAKLLCTKGEFVCVLRDVSSVGISVRCFHKVPQDKSIALELQNGSMFELERVRGEGCEAAFTFATGQMQVEQLIREQWAFPRRALRLAVTLPLTLRTPSGPIAAITQNISQQGCRIEPSTPLALSQPVIVEGSSLPGMRAKVRWRQDRECGLVFDDTFSLRDFAVFAAKVQCPGLIQ